MPSGRGLYSARVEMIPVVAGRGSSYHFQPFTARGEGWRSRKNLPCRLCAPRAATNLRRSSQKQPQSTFDRRIIPNGRPACRSIPFIERNCTKHRPTIVSVLWCGRPGCNFALVIQPSRLQPRSCGAAVPAAGSRRDACTTRHCNAINDDAYAGARRAADERPAATRRSGGERAWQSIGWTRNRKPWQLGSPFVPAHRGEPARQAPSGND